MSPSLRHAVVIRKSNTRPSASPARFRSEYYTRTRDTVAFFVSATAEWIDGASTQNVRARLTVILLSRAHDSRIRPAFGNVDDCWRIVHNSRNRRAVVTHTHTHTRNNDRAKDGNAMGEYDGVPERYIYNGPRRSVRIFFENFPAFGHLRVNRRLMNPRHRPAGSVVVNFLVPFPFISLSIPPSLFIHIS